MNILFSCDEYPPARTGGIGSATKNVCEALAARGHKVYVVSCRLPGHNLPSEAVINNVTVYRLTIFSKLAFLLNTQWKMDKIHCLLLRSGILRKYAVEETANVFTFVERLLNEKNIDVIEVPDYSILDKYYIDREYVPAHKYSVPCVGRVHGSKSFLTYNRCGQINPITRRNNISFFNNCDKILAVSRFSANFVNKELGVEKQCDVIYNPLDTSFIDYARNLSVSRKKNVVFLGKVIESKGAFNLLKAFEIFSAKHPEYKLVMIGGGLLEKAKTIVSKDLYRRIEFTGYLDRYKIAQYLKSAAFCVIPTFYENFSVAALEVMGCGNILIYTTAASGPETIEEGIDGFLVDPHSVEAIESKMSYVADNLETLVHIRERAMSTVDKRFRQDIIIDQLEQYYSSVIRTR